MARKKKRNRRQLEKYPMLHKHLNLKTRSDELEIDYAHKLSDKDKDFLNRFNEESIGANFKHEGKRLHKKVNKPHPQNIELKKLEQEFKVFLKEIELDLKNKFKGVKEDLKARGTLKSKVVETFTKLINVFQKQLIKELRNNYSIIEDIYRKEAEHKNNARNRCILTKAKASGKYVGLDDIHEEAWIKEDTEDDIIDSIDDELMRKELDDFNNTHRDSDDK